MSSFIKTLLDLDSNVKTTKPIFRFPPEPNGYLHLGHARSITLNFDLARLYNGSCNLRLDDTNPDAEKIEYADAIEADVAWLGYEWGGKIRYASEWMDTYIRAAYHLIENGLAYVDTSDIETVRKNRGTLTTSGIDSPDKDLPLKTHRLRFTSLLEGSAESTHWVLRAATGMTHANVTMRDPILYRHKEGYDINARHHFAYPMYDFAHPISDAMEGILYSLCTLEFEEHRPLYDWVLKNTWPVLNAPNAVKPTQVEFARLELDHGITSKRKIAELITSGKVENWHDPRLLTLGGLRTRGFTAEAIHLFCDRHAASRSEAIIPLENLNIALRDTLDPIAVRRSVILNPVKATVTGLPLVEGSTIDVPNHPKDHTAGKREWTWSSDIWLSLDDIRLEKEPGFKRMYPGNVIRLMHAGIVRCTSVDKHSSGNILHVHLEAVNDAKPSATLHWLSSASGKACTVMEWLTIDDNSTHNGLITHTAMAEPACFVTDDTWHGLRTGYYRTHTDDVLYLTCRLNNK